MPNMFFRLLNAVEHTLIDYFHLLWIFFPAYLFALYSYHHPEVRILSLRYTNMIIPIPINTKETTWAIRSCDVSIKLSVRKPST